MSNILKILRPWAWFILGFICIGLKTMADVSPQFVEKYYSRGLYEWIRKVSDVSFAYSPVPLFYFFWIGIIFFLYRLLRILTQKNVPNVEKRRIFVLKLLNMIGFLISSFYILWGFNYSRPSFFKQIGLKIEKIDTAQLRQELYITAQEMLTAKRALINMPSLSPLHTDLEKQIRNDISGILQSYHFPAKGNLRARQLMPNGILRRFGATGVYWPWVGECNMDNSVHDLEKPFTLAHELAHGYGWTDEGTCNFLAYLSCRKSNHLFVRYAGAITYYRYVAGNFKRQFPREYEQFREELPADIRLDLNNINANLKLYPEWFDTSFIYEKYLKYQGIKEGLNSYSRIILMVHAWRETEARQ